MTLGHFDFTFLLSLSLSLALQTALAQAGFRPRWATWISQARACVETPLILIHSQKIPGLGAAAVSLDRKKKKKTPVLTMNGGRSSPRPRPAI